MAYPGSGDDDDDDDDDGEEEDSKATSSYRLRKSRHPLITYSSKHI